MMGATMQLAGANLKATVAGKQISANAKLDLAKFEATDTTISNVKIDATLEQVSGVLKGAGTATSTAASAAIGCTTECIAECIA